MKYKINHTFLKEKMTNGTNNLNHTIILCLTCNLYDDMKKIINDYADYDYDWSVVIADCISKKRKEKYFELIKDRINFEKLDYPTVFSHIDLWSPLSKYTNVNIMKYVFDNIIFTDELIETIGTLTSLSIRDILGINNTVYTINRDFNGTIFYWGVNNNWTLIVDEYQHYYNEITANHSLNMLKDTINDYIYVNKQTLI